MSISLTIAECVAYGFNKWVTEQEESHKKAAKAATVSVESRFIHPVESAAARLVDVWVTAVSSKTSDADIDVKALLVGEGIHKLIAYLYRIGASSFDVALFDKAWVHYKTECGQMGRWRFDSCVSSELTCVDDFFNAITLANMFDAFEKLVGDKGVPEFWHSKYRIFWIVRSMCGIEIDGRALDPIATQMTTTSSISQRAVIDEASRSDDLWASEFAVVSTSFAKHAVSMSAIAMENHLAQIQLGISERFISMLAQFNTINQTSISEHALAYTVSQDVGVVTSHSMIVARIQSAMGEFMSFINGESSERRIDTISVYIEQALASIVAPANRLSAESVAYAKAIQEYELAAYSIHLLDHSRASLKELSALVGGLFPVPSGLSDEFSSVLEHTVQLHRDIASLYATVVERIRIDSTTTTLETAKARFEQLRVVLKSDAISIDVDSFLVDLFTHIRLRISQKDTIHAIRLIMQTRMSYIRRVDYTLESQHTKATSKLDTFDREAVAYLELTLTSNADVVSAKTKLSTRSIEVQSMWSDVASRWKIQCQRLPRVYIFESTNKKVVPDWVMPDAVLQSMQQLILMKHVESYITDFVALYNELKASGHVSAVAMHTFGIQAAIISETLGSKRITRGLTLGRMMRGVEIVILTMTQTQVVDDASKSIEKYNPSVDAASMTDSHTN